MTGAGICFCSGLVGRGKARLSMEVNLGFTRALYTLGAVSVDGLPSDEPGAPSGFGSGWCQ